MKFFNKLAASPAEWFSHYGLLNSQRDAYQRGVNNFCSSFVEGLASIGYEMSSDPGVAAILDVSAIMKLLHADL